MLPQRLFREIAADIFGIGDDDYGCLDGGPALIYLIRRFGFPTRGSDEYKRLLDYTIPTSRDGFGVNVSFMAGGAMISAVASRALNDLVRREMSAMLDGWRRRCFVWGSVRGYRLIDYGDMGAFRDYGQQWVEFVGVPQWKFDKFGEYLALQGLPNSHDPIYALMGNLYHHWRWETVGNEDKELVEDLYGEIEPYPDVDDLGSYGVGSVVHELVGVWRLALADLLVPTNVRDAYINILGAVDDVVVGYDEDADELVNYAPPHPSAGYGVPREFVADAGGFQEFVADVEWMGGGDFWGGVRHVRGMVGVPAKRERFVRQNERDLLPPPVVVSGWRVLGVLGGVLGLVGLIVGSF